MNTSCNFSYFLFRKKIIQKNKKQERSWKFCSVPSVFELETWQGFQNQYNLIIYKTWSFFCIFWIVFGQLKKHACQKYFYAFNILQLPQCLRYMYDISIKRSWIWFHRKYRLFKSKTPECWHMFLHSFFFSGLNFCNVNKFRFLSSNSFWQIHQSQINLWSITIKPATNSWYRI